MKIVEVANNDSGDPWVWLIREHPTGQAIGMVLPDGDKFEAFDHVTGVKSKGVKLRPTVASLYQASGESVEVRIASDITISGIPGDELLNPWVFE